MPGCGTRQFENISQNTIDAILDSLRSKGATTEGNNPWTVDMPNFGVKMLGEWNADTKVLSITVQETGWFVPCQAVWSNIDGLITALNARNAKTETA
ncbi:MAG TPA: hypothetical protein VK654_13060 [Nitrospirota bacterium]|nr:hypothetical protein [Nitrospirota bacterium]